jgi:Ca-activated chloride channel family protein
MIKPSTFVRAFVTIMVALIFTPAFAQKPTTAEQAADDDVVRVSTTLVTLPVSVVDHGGKFIPNLKQEQFRIYEDGIEHEITYFENAEKVITVALLIDTSDSTKFKLSEIQDAAIAFIEELRPNDRALVIAFDERVKVLTELTNERRLLTEAISRAQTGGGTSLYAAVDLVIK